MTSQTAAASATAPQFFAPLENDNLSSHLHRQLVGWLAILLSVLLLLIDRVRPTKGLQGLLDSVSAYYYTGGVAAFVGSLVALSIFFFTYRGYGNERRNWDRIAALIATAASLCVAFFPTKAPGKLLPPSWWTDYVGNVHHISAVVLFGCLIIFCFLFATSKNKKTTEKKVRNFIYYLCALGMLACVVWAWRASAGGSIFWPETFALVFFGVSWLTKGRAEWTLLTALKHPRHFFRALGRGIRDWDQPLVGNTRPPPAASSPGSSPSGRR